MRHVQQEFTSNSDTEQPKLEEGTSWVRLEPARLGQTSCEGQHGQEIIAFEIFVIGKYRFGCHARTE